MASSTDLESNHGAAGEVSKAIQGGVEAGGGADGSNEAFREEGADAVRVAQGQDVDVHLGSAGEGDSAHVGGDDVDIAVWYGNGPGVGVDDTLVIEL